ncbi:Protein of unknown function [Desulfacinum hydrothermale DSM 13146]|uniref:DUF3150 domain-containing protein n=1 Tax=Desulfacinum hydrothermale DSM 13146 TaxID=1121390 RepID=A0A1W1XW51_9BACT|nr:DUF3150 domain-containing protein [Desulfacinum hydrothermale]SMC28085.1 Protein of unknown function [Desulfacinum hydrothermale DSM 13146]
MIEQQQIHLELSKVVLVRADICIWSGKKRLTARDLDLEDLPEDLFELGNKRLIDKAHLRPFEAIRKRTERTLRTHGTKFLGAWMVPLDRSQELCQALDGLKEEFIQKKTDFLANLESYLDEWRQAHPEWAKLLHTIPEEISDRFSFSWQAFQIIPGEGVEESFRNTPSTFLREIAEDTKPVWERIVKEKARKVASLRPLKKLLPKITGFAFLDQTIHTIGTDLETVLSPIDWSVPNQPVSPRLLAELRKILFILQNPNMALRYSEAMKELKESTQDDEWDEGPESEQQPEVVEPVPKKVPLITPDEWF